MLDSKREFIYSDCRPAIKAFERGVMSDQALRILRKADPSALKHHTVIWFPAHLGQVPGALSNLNEIAHDAARALTDRTATGQPHLAGLDTNRDAPITYNEITKHFYLERRIFPPPHPKLNRPPALTLRLLQKHTYPNLATLHVYYPDAYPSDTCPSCGHTATLEHMLWECRTTPPDSTSSKWERSLRSSLLADQQWAVQQAHKAAVRFWHRSRRESYEQEAVDLFLTRIHQALQNKTQQPAAHGIVSREYNIAKLYDSCLNFVVQDQKTKFVESVRSSEDLFRFIVGTSLSTGLPSVVRITLRSGSMPPSVFVPVIDMGQTLRASLHYVDVPPYLQEAIGDLQIPDGAEVIEAATKIDEAVETWRVQADRSEAFAILRLGQLGKVVVGASWTEALNTGLPKGHTAPQFTANDTAKIRAREMIHGALTVLLLGRESIQHVRLYVVLLLLAQVMKYRYLLERPLERTLKDHAWCLHETAVLSSSQGSLNTGFSTSSPAAAPTSYGDHFLLNVARASKDSVFPAVFQRESSTSTGSEGNTDMDAGTLAALQIEGTISYDAHTRQLLVPAVWLLDLMFVRDGSFPVLDVAALGVRLLAVWIRAQLAGRPQVLENLKSTAECHGYEFETPLDEDNSDQVVREVASTEWALRIAFQASRSRERLAADVLQDRVFFWRFCQTHCGDVVGRDACEFAVHLAEGFRDAFECREFVPPHCWA
ncbi:hypothetical protein HPB51_023220 [Rhipicephalus microplus]|uniref:Tick transposon n=1 Tax=Rhipicephalus microplus TaxID=6941 RepID=A0A9J6ECM6_RHIMP|nr:hypothetical protein HPB51_023220 [Rhipicephalus microplus]